MKTVRELRNPRERTRELSRVVRGHELLRVVLLRPDLKLKVAVVAERDRFYLIDGLEQRNRNFVARMTRGLAK